MKKNLAAESVAEAPNEHQPNQSSFLKDTEHIADKISDAAPVPIGTPATQELEPVEGWTAQQVAEQFEGMFLSLAVLLPLVRKGPTDHWSISAPGVKKLGEAFLPIFERHIPYGVGAPAWLADAMMYLGAFGAARAVLRPAFEMEIQILRSQGGKLVPLRAGVREFPRPSTRGESTPENTQTATSAESSSSPESAAAENQNSKLTNWEL